MMIENSNEYNLIFFFVISGIGYFEFDWSIHAGDKSTQEAAKRQNEFATIPLTVIGLLLNMYRTV